MYILDQNQNNSVVDWGEQGYCIATNSYFGFSSLIHIFFSKGNDIKMWGGKVLVKIQFCPQMK